MLIPPLRCFGSYERILDLLAPSMAAALPNAGPVRSTSMGKQSDLVSRAGGKDVTTIEGLSPDLSHPLQRAWIEIDVPQCGYCQSGQTMSAAVLLREIPNPTDDDINQALTGNVCRCGTYPRIRQAIHHAAELARGGAK